jgi:hypothetical protein
VLEREVLKAVLEFLQWKGIFCWRQNQGAIPLPQGGFRRFVGLKGVSDILGIVGSGRFLAIEVKGPKGRLRPDQEEFLSRVASLGGVAIVCSSVEELERDLISAGVL